MRWNLKEAVSKSLVRRTEITYKARLREIHLDASIDKLDNLAINVQLDKEKYMEKEQRQTEPERAEAERVEAGIGT